VAADEQAGDRRHQRRRGDRGPRARALLRRSDRLGARPVRRHPCAGWTRCPRGVRRAAAAEGRCRHGPADEPRPVMICRRPMRWWLAL